MNALQPHLCRDDIMYCLYQCSTLYFQETVEQVAPRNIPCSCEVRHHDPDRKRSRLERSEMGKQRVSKFASGHIGDPLCQVAFLLDKQSEVQQSSLQNTYVSLVGDLLRCRTLCKPRGRVMRHVSREAVCIG